MLRGPDDEAAASYEYEHTGDGAVVGPVVLQWRSLNNERYASEGARGLSPTARSSSSAHLPDVVPGCLRYTLPRRRCVFLGNSESACRYSKPQAATLGGNGRIILCHFWTDPYSEVLNVTNDELFVS
mmetsp:Transcript_30993/g.77620  ORF Transcript_30993/g.77620 Transcript_30993/m.77620 type:complete len:127 (+) Transcript_30993:844-1224(+)|eukprot:CAMPEP_0181361284 /NCGR_PEP_ID=MMETSP1106-20121128/7189_1 /TAXON_ID=81844 /ORGANISM="Mantoniella antarctica, Strain SL-175" /LENGTH=126 /DNA_ID=CAMNT_0023474757 /DNA_START=1100 /DNA_END=1480 /DNA_ORIENTATION=+